MLGLHSGALSLLLALRVGGSIARFEREGVPILRGCVHAEANVLEMGSFPLVPYVNRIRGGAFIFRGREVRLATNMAGSRSPLHGVGWLSPWGVESASESEALLSFDHEPGEWPWRFHAAQHFRLAADTLEVDLSCRNLSDEPMPCGLGQHPYFPCDASTRLRTEVTHAWTIDADILPVRRVRADGRYDLHNRSICGQDLDNGFEGWSGTAFLSGIPGLPFDIELSSPDAHFFQVYSPANGGLFVAEPVSHRNAALNEPEADWAQAGLRVLAPGEETSLSMRLALVSADR